MATIVARHAKTFLVTKSLQQTAASCCRNAVSRSTFRPTCILQPPALRPLAAFRLGAKNRCNASMTGMLVLVPHPLPFFKTFKSDGMLATLGYTLHTAIAPIKKSSAARKLEASKAGKLAFDTTASLILSPKQSAKHANRKIHPPFPTSQSLTR